MCSTDPAVGSSSPDASLAATSRARARASLSCCGSSTVSTVPSTSPPITRSSVIVSVSRGLMYESSNSPMRTVTSRPSGSVAVSSTGCDRRLTAGSVTVLSGVRGMLPAVIPERLVRIRARTVLAILGIVISTFVVLDLLWIARGVLTWIIIAAFLALALNPAVEGLVGRGLGRRTAVAIVFLAAIAAIIGIAALFIPTLVHEVNGFRDAVPDYVDDVTHGRGPVGRLAEKYHLVQRVKKAV